MSRYAWLEHDGVTWRLVTSPLADYCESTRQWSSGRNAILELMEEGWTIVGPYPGIPMLDTGQQIVHGYGLTRSVH